MPHQKPIAVTKTSVQVFVLRGEVFFLIIFPLTWGRKGCTAPPLICIVPPAMRATVPDTFVPTAGGGGEVGTNDVKVGPFDWFLVNKQQREGGLGRTRWCVVICTVMFWGRGA